MTTTTTTLPKTFTLHFTKDDRRVTYTHDDQGMRFTVYRNIDAGTDIITVDSPDGMNFIMNLLAADGYTNPAAII